EELTGSLGKRGVHDLTILAVGPVPAHVDIRAAIPLLFTVVVQRPLARPAVVGRPGGVAALKGEVAGPGVADGGGGVTLERRALGCQFSQISSAGPVFGNG